LDVLIERRPAHLGEKSPVLLARREIGALPPAARAEAGKRVQETQAEIKAAYERRHAELTARRDDRMLREEAVGRHPPVGPDPARRPHPITTMSERIGDVFVGMGWRSRTGPRWRRVVQLRRVEHRQGPSGADHAGHLLRGARELGAGAALADLAGADPVAVVGQAAVYVVSPGRVFRTDDLDATHSPVFHQTEGLAVDKGLTMANLKGTLDAFARAVIGPTARCGCGRTSSRSPSRPRDGHLVRGEEGRAGLGRVGAAHVNPRVLVACGVDPDVYSGFAFGMGIERTLMFRNGLPDMRDMIEGDVRFTTAFGMEA